MIKTKLVLFLLLAGGIPFLLNLLLKPPAKPLDGVEAEKTKPQGILKVLKGFLPDKPEQKTASKTVVSVSSKPANSKEIFIPEQTESNYYRDLPIKSKEAFYEK